MENEENILERRKYIMSNQDPEYMNNSPSDNEHKFVGTNKPKYICTTCGACSNLLDRKCEGGSGCSGCLVPIGLTLGIIGLFFYIFPGVIILLLTFILNNSIPKKKQTIVCYNCNNENTMIPINTPNGKSLFEKFHPEWNNNDYETLVNIENHSELFFKPPKKSLKKLGLIILIFYIVCMILAVIISPT